MRHLSLGTWLGVGWGEHREPEGVGLVHISNSMQHDCSTEPPPPQGRKGQASQVCPHFPCLTPALVHGARAAAHSGEAAWMAGCWGDAAMVVIFCFDSSLPADVIHHTQHGAQSRIQPPCWQTGGLHGDYVTLTTGREAPTQHRDGCSLACCAEPWR